MSAPHRIGILTFHRCINYASYWQARCLAEGIRARGHEVEILDPDSRRVSLAEWKCALRPVLPTPVPKRDRLLYSVLGCHSSAGAATGMPVPGGWQWSSSA